MRRESGWKPINKSIFGSLGQQTREIISFWRNIRHNLWLVILKFSQYEILNIDRQN